MAIIEAHIGLIPSRLAEEHRLLYTRDGLTVVNRVGNAEDVEAFMAGISEFDLLVESAKSSRHRLEKYEEEGYVVRSMNHRSGLEGRAVSVLEPMPEHPLHDPAADAQYFFEAHSMSPNVRGIWRPDRDLVHPFVALGKVATLINN